MTAYTAANMASGQATYRSAPQGQAVRTSATTSRSLTTSVSPTSRTAKPPVKPTPSKTVKRK